MDLQRLLDEARSAYGETSDSGLARRLGVKRQTVSSWRHGVSLPDVVTCEKLAKITGKKAVSVIAAINEQREISQDAKAVWRRLGAAAVVVLATGITAIPSHAAATLNATQGMHYAKFFQLARFLFGRLRNPWRHAHGSPALLAC